MDILGIDPGLSGAMALLRTYSSTRPQFIDMADIPTCADNSNRQIDVAAFKAILERWEPDVAIIEDVQPMPAIPNAQGIRVGMPAASSFRFGLGCGMIRGAVMAYEIPVILVHAQSWKRHFKLIGAKRTVEKTAGKAADRARLLELHPETAPWLTRVKDHQRADAGLMALWHAEKRGML